MSKTFQGGGPPRKIVLYREIRIRPGARSWASELIPNGRLLWTHGLDLT